MQRPRPAGPPERVTPIQTLSPGARAVWPLLLGLLLLALYAIARRFREKKKPKIAKESYEITDVDLLKMRGLDQQTSLFLANSQVTDEGLAHFEGCAALESLDLWDTRITDAGLRHLAKLTSIREFILNQIRVSPDGITQLQETLPGCRLRFS